MNSEHSQLFDLPIQDQLRLVEDLWDHIAASSEPLPLPEWQKEELDRRKKRHEANPDSAIPWDDAVRQIRRK